ncbi:arginine--tRNA ligase [Candidatus Woesearchaeota archaeon]|nr:MAG: arginine--tRNA ligase [Candidatus Woesearchaeota archaeon]
MYKNLVLKILKKHVKEDIVLEVPPNPELGDYAFPCFTLARKYKKNPSLIAEELASKIKPTKYIVKIENVGPYVNFFLNKTYIADTIINKILTEKSSFGSSNIGKGKKALIEHTSINPNASPHMGRSRNAIIGDSISRMLRFQGYKTTVHYFVNDIGKQIAMLVLASQGKNLKFEQLLDAYVKLNNKLKSNPELEKQIFDIINKLELGDKKVKNEFRKIVDTCIKGQTNILSELGIKYDKFDYESKYLWDNSTKEIIKKLERTDKVFIDENNRKVLDLKGHNLSMRNPVLVLTRNDGTSLYVVRDMAYTIDKMKKANDVNLIILGEDHKLYFEQLKIALSMLKVKSPVPIYYSYILLKGQGKMSTRKGTLVLLEDVMKEALSKAEKEIIKRHGKVKDLKKRAKIIAYGAIKYSILKVSRDKNVFFDIEEALSFEGDSAPYLQYVYARINSLFKKGQIKGKIDYSLLTRTEEDKLITLLSQFQESVHKSFTSFNPHIIANYLSDLGRAYNEFYHNCPILTEDEKLKNARLILSKAVMQVLKNGLDLLGIETLDVM